MNTEEIEVREITTVNENNKNYEQYDLEVNTPIAPILASQRIRFIVDFKNQTIEATITNYDKWEKCSNEQLYTIANIIQESNKMNRSFSSILNKQVKQNNEKILTSIYNLREEAYNLSGEILKDTTLNREEQINKFNLLLIIYNGLNISFLYPKPRYDLNNTINKLNKTHCISNLEIINKLLQSTYPVYPTNKRNSEQDLITISMDLGEWEADLTCEQKDNVFIQELTIELEKKEKNSNGNFYERFIKISKQIETNQLVPPLKSISEIYNLEIPDLIEFIRGYLVAKEWDFIIDTDYKEFIQLLHELQES